MSLSPRVLIVDDDAAVVELLEEILAPEGYRVEGTTSAVEALERCRAGGVDLVLSDVEMPELRGTRLLDALTALQSPPLVVLITAFGTVDLAVQALKAGATDFVSKPFSPATIRHVVARALRERSLRREVRRLRRYVEQKEGAETVVAASAAMRRVLELAERLARTDGPVLLTGESGTGKSVLARWMHRRSDRANGPFVAVRCSTLQEDFAEAEVFGTDADAGGTPRRGLLQQAHGGTLFLDEVEDLPRTVQARMLRVLEGGAVRRLGGAHDELVDVRVLAATHVDLDAAAAEGNFRRDLLYRLAVFRLHLPPLRERPEDVAPLAEAWLRRLADRHGRRVELAPDAWRFLLGHDWPGNVRELVNRLERGVVLAESGRIGAADLAGPDLAVAPTSAGPAATDLAHLVAAGLTLEDVERLFARAVLDASAGNKAEAARRLGVDRKTLYRKLAEDDETD